MADMNVSIISQMEVTTLLTSAQFFEQFDQADLQKFTSGTSFSQDDPSNNSLAWLLVAYCTLLTVGVIGNVWVASVIGCILRASSSQFGVLGSSASEVPKPIQIYILSLCLSDLIVLAFLLFLIADLIYGQWIFPMNTAICRLYLSSESLNKFCGPFLLVALSGYCYVSVCKRQWKLGNRIFSTNTICAIVLAICISLVLLLISPVFVYGDVLFIVIHNASGDVIYSITPKCALQPPEPIFGIFTFYSFVCGYVIPGFLFTFFYASILRTAYKQVSASIRKKRLGDGQQIVAGGSVRRRKRRSYLSRVVKTSMGLVMFYLVCWTPYWTMILYHYLSPHHGMRQSFMSVVYGYLIHILPYINCTGYPILYTVLNKTIKDAYRQRSKHKRQQNANNQLQAHLLSPKEADKLGLDIESPPTKLLEFSIALSTLYDSHVDNNGELGEF